MSDFTFNQILDRRGVNLDSCRIVRHDTRGLQAWRHSRGRLESFFGFQRTGGRTPYRGASVIFQFVPVGRSPEGSRVALQGLYRNQGAATALRQRAEIASYA
jgi:hypothetical protein